MGSLRAALIARSVVSILCAAGLAVLLSHTAGDTAVAATKAAGDGGVAECFATSERVVGLLTEQLMEASITGVSSGLHGYLEHTTLVLGQLHDFVRGIPAALANNLTWMEAELRPVMTRAFLAGNRKGLTALSYYVAPADPAAAPYAAVILAEFRGSFGRPHGEFHFWSAAHYDAAARGWVTNLIDHSGADRAGACDATRYAAAVYGDPDEWVAAGEAAVAAAPPCADKLSQKHNAWCRHGRVAKDPSVDGHNVTERELCNCTLLIEHLPCGYVTVKNRYTLDISAQCPRTCGECGEEEVGDPLSFGACPGAGGPGSALSPQAHIALHQQFAALAPLDEVSWGATRYHRNYLSVSSFLPFALRGRAWSGVHGARVGVFEADIETYFVDGVMRAMPLPTGSRIFGYECIGWVCDAWHPAELNPTTCQEVVAVKAEHGAEERTGFAILPGRRCGTLVGASHGADARADPRLYQYETGYIPEASVPESRDPVIAALGRHIEEEGYAVFGARRGAAEWEAPGGARYFVAAGRLPQQRSLEWYVVVAVPYDAVMAEVSAAVAATRARVAERNDAAAAERAESTYVMLAAVAALAALLVAASAGIAIGVTRPLLVLEQQMARVARMETGDIGFASRSALAEVASMQDSFLAMAESLNMYRPFLPHSCLPADVVDDSSDSQGSEDSAGSAAYRSARGSLAGSPTHRRDGRSRPSHLVGVMAERRSQVRRMSPQASPGSSSGHGGAGTPGRAGRHMSAQSPPTTSPMLKAQHGHSAAHPGVALVMKSPKMMRQGSIPGGGLRPDPRTKSVTLAALNRRGFLHALSRTTAEAAACYVELIVDLFTAQVGRFRGITDLIAADHAFASFGAARACPGHRLSGLRCAAQLTTPEDQTAVGMLRRGKPAELAQLAASSAVCSSQAVCGDFGSAAMRRFMVLGGVSSSVVVIERLAARWGIDVLVDSTLYAGVNTAWCCRIAEWVLYFKAGKPTRDDPKERQFFLWEMIGERLLSEDTKADHEPWMLEAMAQGQNPWEAYNNAMKLWCEGRSQEASVAASEALEQTGLGTDKHGRRRPLTDHCAGTAVGLTNAETTVMFAGRTVSSLEVIDALGILQQRIASGALPGMLLQEVVTAQAPQPKQQPPCVDQSVDLSQLGGSIHPQQPQSVQMTAMFAEYHGAQRETQRVQDEEQRQQAQRLKEAVELRLKKRDAAAHAGKSHLPPDAPPVHGQAPTSSSSAVPNDSDTRQCSDILKVAHAESQSLLDRANLAPRPRSAPCPMQDAGVVLPPEPKSTTVGPAGNSHLGNAPFEDDAYRYPTVDVKGIKRNDMFNI